MPTTDTRLSAPVMTGDRRPTPPTPRPPTDLPPYLAGNGGAHVVREASAVSGTVLLTLTGSFGVGTVACLHEALADARHERATHTVLDLARVTSGDSFFLHELLSAHFSHRELLLIGPIPLPLHHLFLRTGTLRLFTVLPDRARVGFA
ncbi:STAS domain-containing protein [Streptomyces sp. NPDC058128]|uniref:STAS domain-containing protein n=1 Tax=Streptomyces sp. NPDC058128 TaxID=3346352 RepID=UPI0036EF7BC0